MNTEKLMLSKLKALAMNPTFWVVLVVVGVAFTAYSALRKPFQAIASKLPKADLGL